MDHLNIEHTLLEYHKAMGKDWRYSIVAVDQLPEDAIYIRSVCLNGTHIQFYEDADLDTRCSTIFWRVEFIELSKKE